MARGVTPWEALIDIVAVAASGSFTLSAILLEADVADVFQCTRNHVTRPAIVTTKAISPSVAVTLRCPELGLRIDWETD